MTRYGLYFFPVVGRLFILLSRVGFEPVTLALAADALPVEPPMHLAEGVIEVVFKLRHVYRNCYKLY